MLLIIIILAELVILFFLTQILSRGLYMIIRFIFRSPTATAAIISFIYLPGTAVHEFAHLISAEILRVPTGELSFTPQLEKNDRGDEEIKTGSLKIAAVDPFRRFLIGIAPLIFGLMFTMLLVWLFLHFWPQTTDTYQRIGLVLISGYLLFSVSNNMFSSKTDMEGSLPLLIVLAIIITALYLSGVRLNLTGRLVPVINNLLQGLTLSLGIVIGINLLFLFISRFILSGIRKLLRTRIN